MATMTLAELYERHFDFVWRLLRRFGVSAANLDDAAQEVFVVAHRRWDSFVQGTEERSWLAAIAQRVASAQRRASGRRSTDELSEALVDERPDPLVLTERSQQLKLVYALLDELGEEQREVFVLAEMERFTAPEIAAVLKLNVNTVYSRLRLARAAFAAALERRGTGGDHG